MPETLIEVNDAGIYCPIGDFYVDPWTSVARAVVTHGHRDHLVRDCDRYICTQKSLPILRQRLGEQPSVQALPFGVPQIVQGVRLSLHPAGHILGSAQVRLEYRGQVVVVTGDYKRQPDPTCDSFEPLPCHLLVTESTFGLPIYRWPDPEEVLADIGVWWRRNAAAEKTSVLFAYALGKSQRLLAGIDPTIGAIYTHGAVESMCEVYRRGGVPLPPTERVGEKTRPRPPRGTGYCPAIGARHSLDAPAGSLSSRDGVRMDAHPWHSSPPRDGPRICHLGPCRLARATSDRGRKPSGADLDNPWICVAGSRVPASTRKDGASGCRSVSQ